MHGVCVWGTFAHMSTVTALHGSVVSKRYTGLHLSATTITTHPPTRHANANAVATIVRWIAHRAASVWTLVAFQRKPHQATLNPPTRFINGSTTRNIIVRVANGIIVCESNNNIGTHSILVSIPQCYTHSATISILQCDIRNMLGNNGRCGIRCWKIPNSHDVACEMPFIYGIVGTTLVFCLRGFSSIHSNLHIFIEQRPQLPALLCMGITAGVFGTYFLYCAFDSCGDNKALAVIISYCVPVVIVSLLSYFVLGEQYNLYAVLGVMMIVASVLLIDVLGIDSVVVANQQ